MKILEIVRSYSPSVGGIEKFAESRLSLYKHLEFDCTLLATDFSSEKTIYAKKNSDILFVKQYTPYNICPSIYRYLKHSYDLISINQMGRFFSDFVVPWAKRNHIPVVITPHYFYHTSKYKLIKFLVSEIFIKKSLKQCDGLICFTESEKQFWLQYCPIIEPKIKVIPHYYEKTNFSTTLERNENQYILYLGRYSQNKRIDLLLEAFSKIETPNCDLYLTVSVEQLPPKLQVYKNKSNIKFLGDVSEVVKLKLMMESSAVILPTEYEAFGIVLLEASDFMKPILASRLSVLEDIHSKDGTFFFENDVRSIHETLVSFMRNTPIERAMMGKKNYENLDRFNLSIISEKYMELYSRILQNYRG